MPELPEVETIRRDLQDGLTGQTIVGVRIHKPDIILGGLSPRSFASRVRGRRVTSIRRRAKYLLLDLDDGASIQVQLRMSGRFALTVGRPDPSEFRHIAAELHLGDGRTLWYDDVRRLGGFQLMNADEVAVLDRRLGPEPLEDSFTARRFSLILSGLRGPIKNVIMDQRRVAGIGNIYASEALFLARIDPRRAAGSLDEREVRVLRRTIRRVLREAIRSAGTTFRDYRAVNGRSGEFQTRLTVYAREDKLCVRCRTPIQRVVQAGRSTFYCPECQI
jgi:formamidopyrimidine-DNA glycosylase